MSIIQVAQTTRQFMALSTDNISTLRDPGTRVYFTDKKVWGIVGANGILEIERGQGSSDFHALRKVTAVANEEVIDFSVFSGGASIVEKMIFMPDTSCSVIINGRTFTDRIENGLEIKTDDMNIFSMKIVEPGTGFYIQYFVR